MNRRPAVDGYLERHSSFFAFLMFFRG